MNDTNAKAETLKSRIAGGLIVSCQAPADSPMARPEVIAALAETAGLNGAVGVRIDTPAHIRAVRRAADLPVIGIYKLSAPDSEVYITPTRAAARAIAEAGADLIALDATRRARPGGETLAELCRTIREDLRLPSMADIATFDEGVHAAETHGCSFVGTTLSGYTAETAHLLTAPDFRLIETLAARLAVPVIAEGRLATPDDVRRAFEAGATAVVVGNALTGFDAQIRKFAAAGTPERRQPGTPSS